MPLHRAQADRGATAVEYAIMASLIAAVIVGAVAALGTATLGLFQPVVTFFQSLAP